MNSTPDAAVYTTMLDANGAIYLFKEDKVWEYHVDGNDLLYLHNGPLPISSKFGSHMGQDWDACMESEASIYTIYCFKGNLRYKLSNTSSIQTLLNFALLGIPDNLDSSFLDTSSMMAYFFKGSRYYRYNYAKTGSNATAGYPKCISDLIKIPGMVCYMLPFLLSLL